jgi:hypothetical protein
MQGLNDSGMTLGEALTPFLSQLHARSVHGWTQSLSQLHAVVCLEIGTLKMR